ncbi:hypothetical protein F5Y19DRAFT_240411 [Xylariaceae sp. FL1651]|nr:hypothetical protein F5Y19DRAFT_240411 [Xylariaceae sp. FL1651]
MNNQWLRAFRSAAPNPRQTHLLSRPTRTFHSSNSNRGPNDSAPRDDGSKPQNETSNGETDNTAENLLGEAITATNGEGQGRRKPVNGLRSRASRNRKSDLPPIQIPKSFLSLAISRNGETKSRVHVEPREQSQDSANAEIEAARVNQQSPRRNTAIFEAAMWSTSTVEEALEALNSEDRINSIMRKIDILNVSAYWTVVHQVKKVYGDDAYVKILESGPAPSSLDWQKTLLNMTHGNFRPPMINEPDLVRLLINLVVNDGDLPLAKVALYEPCIVDEIITAIRADLSIRAPENTKLAGLRRPATVINVLDCSGFSVAQDTVQHIADKLEVDVIHLRAPDIAHIVGRYIGQDATRAPGDISLLGYKAAENCGRLKARPVAEEDNEDMDTFELPYAIMLREERSRKDARRHTASMDEFLLNSGTRGKSDELWEDMKVNAALDELVHSADLDVAEQKPLIVHINDFNALNMDLECAATILSKIRKVVDELWLTGRKIALVGSCSSKDAPKAYQATLRALETTERVIHLSARYTRDPRVRLSIRDRMALWEKQDYLRENDENIVRMLWSMTESDDSIPAHPEGTLGLARYGSTDDPRFMKYQSSVLPLTEVYRIATTMIGLNSTSNTKLFSLGRLDEALAKLAKVDDARERLAGLQRGRESIRRGSKGGILTGTRKMDPFAENHEEKLMSGLVNAQDMRTSFKDIHAPRETIESIKMLTTLSLVRPEAFSYGVLASDRIPGCLLYGPPGTGKTLLAKAVAKESGANMIEISGALINNMYVGESEKNVRALFRLAKKKEPMVIFIDEADALLGARGGRENGARRETINQFLREWDGMDKMKAFIMVATNRPFDLDEAVLRRLPRKLLIDLPLEPDRAAILRIHLRDEVVDETVSIEDIAKQTPLYSGSDLKNMCVAAAMAAVKEELEASERHTGPEPYKWTKKRVLNRRHFDKALKEIGASVSEDMATLAAIRKFDERYGDGKARKKRKGMGFGVVPEAADSDQARVRSGR